MLASGPPIASGLGGVDELPLWRSTMNMVNEQIKTNMNINKEQRKMVGPLKWQQIHNR